MAGLKGLDLTGLENLGTGGPAHPKGEPLVLHLDDVIEDPGQPRVHFDEVALGELAASIKAAGKVKHPISVKPANADGKHIINDGARRYRASRLANMGTIRAFIDEDHDAIDQVVANLLREGNTPREIGNTLQREIDAGRMTPESICERTGKDKTWVSRHLSIANAPEEIRALIDRCPDYKAAATLVGLYKKDPQQTIAAITGLEHITRADVSALDAQLKGGNPGKPSAPSEKKSPAAAGKSQPQKSKATPGGESTPATGKTLFDQVYAQQSEGVAVAEILSSLPGEAASQLAKDLAVFNKEGVASGAKFSSELIIRLLQCEFSVQQGEGFYRMIAFIQGGTDKKAISVNRLLESVLKVAAGSIRT